MSDKTINDINLNKYFKNYYDNWGRLYCVEYKGSPLELQRAIKHLQEENEELKEKAIKYTEENGNLIIQINTIENKLRDTENRLISLQKANLHNLVLLKRYKQSLEEIRNEIGDLKDINKLINLQKILDKINEALNERYR